MKLSCTQENFKRAIFNTERVIGKQSSLPILENILLETEKGMLKVSATNLELGVSIRIGAKIEESGKITIPAKLIGNFVNNLPNEDNVILETKDQVLQISSGKYKADIKGLEAQDFPIIPETTDEILFSFSAQNIREFIPKIIPCVSVDNTRPEISGINMILNEKITLAATDSFRLAEAEVSLNKKNNYSTFINKTSSLIIPSNAFLEVLRIITPETEEIDVAIEENQIFFQIENTKIVSRLINGKYPEYKQIIPEKFETKIILKKEELLRSVKIASLFTNSKAGEIIFKSTAGEGKIEISAQTEERGENKTELKGKISGPDQEIIFNPRYFLDGINSISTQEIVILINTSSSPVVLRMIDEKEKIQNNFTYIVMPIKK
jgi:DNA polymerase-3 subunit beta